MSDPTLSLPFDQYQRYRLVTDILQTLRGEGERLSILDVGGRTALLRKFLPDDQVFIVDVEESPEEGLVLGTGSMLPFKDNSVDAVVTFDTLEHVPPAWRSAFLSECSRVARRWVVMAGPYDTPGVADSERMLTEFLRDKLNVEHRYLAEHAEHGLPQLDETEAALGADGAQVVSIGHANLHRWLTLMCAELYLDNDAPLRGLATKYYEFYNGAMYASDHRSPVYRHAVVAAQGGAALPTAVEVLGDAQTPDGSFVPVSHILSELLSFDVQRDVITREWDRLEKVNADLLLDLEGHRESLITLKEVNQEQVLVIEELHQRTIELVGNEDQLLATIEDQQNGLSQLEDELARERTESARVAETLRKDLDAHRTFVADLQATEAALRTQVLGLDGVVAELQEQLHVANVTLGQKQTSLDTVRGELTRQRQATDALQAALRDRWGNLLRALGLK